MLAVQVLENAYAGKPVAASNAVASLDRPHLFALIAAIGPVTSAGLASAAEMSRFEAAGWLEKQTLAGYLHRDPATGRYAPWCTVTLDAPARKQVRRLRSRLAGVVATAQQRVVEAMAMTWFGLMGDHWMWPGDDAYYAAALIDVREQRGEQK
jgi:hypothetical protein